MVKRKFKIVKIHDTNRVWYEIHYKHWFWGWLPLEYEHGACIDGLGPESSPLEFKSEEQAEKYLNNYINRGTYDVKYFTYDVKRC